MIRAACALQLFALAVLAVFVVAPTGPNATAFSFLGIPAVLLSFLLGAFALYSRSSRENEAERGRRSG